MKYVRRGHLMNNDQELFAFWRHSQFPYLLGNPVKSFLKEGRVEPEGYPGYKFLPVRIFLKQEGVELQNKLKTLEKEYEKAKVELEKKYTDRVKILMPDVLPSK